MLPILNLQGLPSLFFRILKCGLFLKNKSGKELVKEFEVIASEDALEQQFHLLASPFLAKKLGIFTSMWFVLPSQIREYVNIRMIQITRTLGAQEHEHP
jgi:hypothetical protein